MADNTHARGGTDVVSPEWTRRLTSSASREAADEALKLTQRAEAALERVREGSDPEALHDFRVAVRRLHAWLRSFKTVLAVRGKTRRRLQRLLQSTNRARDAEAALAWMAAMAQDIEPRSRRVLGTVQTELVEELRETHRALGKRAGTAWAKTAKRLRRELEARASDEDTEAAFGTVWSQALKQVLVEAARRRRTAVADAGGAELHRYRIALKRVRYLLEPAAGVLPEVRRVLKQVKYGQDRAGSINDLQLLLAWLRRHAREASARRGESVFDLGLAEQDLEAQRISARTRERLRSLITAARLAQGELDNRTGAFVRAESRSREPRYADGVRRVARLLRPTKPRSARTARNSS